MAEVSDLRCKLLKGIMNTERSVMAKILGHNTFAITGRSVAIRIILRVFSLRQVTKPSGSGLCIDSLGRLVILK